MYFVVKVGLWSVAKNQVRPWRMRRFGGYGSEGNGRIKYGNPGECRFATRPSSSSYAREKRGIGKKKNCYSGLVPTTQQSFHGDIIIFLFVSLGSDPTYSPSPPSSYFLHPIVQSLFLHLLCRPLYAHTVKT